MTPLLPSVKPAVSNRSHESAYLLLTRPQLDLKFTTQRDCCYLLLCVL
jgi:hypothetical protein